jgi:16S rRNA processing protein RimM
MVLVGRIARPHGLRGQVAVNPATDFIDERFRAGATVWTREDGEPHELTISSARVQNGTPIVGFEGFTRIEDVEPLAGRELRVPEASLHPLEEGRYYEHQLVGCSVETVGGETIGQITRVEGGTGGGSRLIVDGPRGEIQVPFVIGLCVEIDVETKKIRIDPPEGLLELNETKRSRQ